MRAVLPGKPQATLQAVCTVQWDGQRLIAYVSGNALVILGGPYHLIQTIYLDDVQSLDGVEIDESTGKIAVSSGSSIYVYQPYGKSEGALKWSLQWHTVVNEAKATQCTLSWGCLDEILVGSSSLRLFQIAENETLIWTRRLSRPVKLACFSPDASFIASTARYDRLVKLWRRLSYGSEDARFDHTYLAHPKTVTGVQWRKAEQQSQGVENVLFTICADYKVRIWAATEPHGLHVFQLWGDIDMLESIQPRHVMPSTRPSDRYAFIVNGHELTWAAEQIVQADRHEQNRHHSIEHLLEVAKSSPDVCVVLDNEGHMSAWGLENIGKSSRSATDIFNIAHIEDFYHFPSRGIASLEHQVQLYSFLGDQPGSTFALLLHQFDGTITWLEARIDHLFDPSPRINRLHPSSIWTGHDAPIKKMVRTVRGKAIVSRTNDNEGLVWKQSLRRQGMGLSRWSTFQASEHIHRTLLLDDGNFIVNLHHNSITLWDAQSFAARQIALCPYEIDGKPLCLIQLPELASSAKCVYLATISSAMKGIVWQIQLPATRNQKIPIRDSEPTHIESFCSFEIESGEDLAFVLPVDPAGSNSTISGFLDTFAKDIAISYTHSGTLCAWTARLNLDQRSINWLITSKIKTGIQSPSLASGSSIRKVAVVDAGRTGLTIWDSRSGQLEYDQKNDLNELIQDLDWSSTPDDQSILAVGFPHRVMILSQMRYDYLSEGAAWAPIREIYVKDSTPHPIGDSVWLGNGNLVVGAGNQLFTYSKAIVTSDDMISDLAVPVHQHSITDIFDVVAHLNGPLPAFHPQFLAQCVLAGKQVQVQKIIVQLQKTLKFYSDGDELGKFLNLSTDEFYDNQKDVDLVAKKEMQSSYAEMTDEVEPETLSEIIAASLNEHLSKIALPHLSNQEQIRLADIVECVATAEKHRRSMDNNAMRYFLFFRHHMLTKFQAPERRIAVNWREIAWAYHSESQDILVDLVSRQFQGRMLWEHARESGLFMWMTDLSALRTQFEVIARNEYSKSDEKNPINCSLYYLALKKKAVLTGLWRMATWHREQSSTQKFLSNNFQEPRWKTAALKNAYALMGRRRFEYAAAFFLLAGNLRDAVSVCTHQMKDLQLAVAVARVYEGDEGCVLRELIEGKILPQAAFEGNRWLATWAFWMLGRRDKAVRVLVSPIHTVLGTTADTSLESKSFLANDPALVVLYKQLRERTLQTLQGASMISPREEWEFVMQNARIYDRMGCDLLALDLVRNWEFLKQPSKSINHKAMDPRTMLRRRSSLVVDDLPVLKSPTPQVGLDGSGISRPTVFEEPDANSLLDSFGF